MAMWASKRVRCAVCQKKLDPCVRNEYIKTINPTDTLQTSAIVHNKKVERLTEFALSNNMNMRAALDVEWVVSEYKRLGLDVRGDLSTRHARDINRRWITFSVLYDREGLLNNSLIVRETTCFAKVVDTLMSLGHPEDLIRDKTGEISPVAVDMYLERV